MLTLYRMELYKILRYRIVWVTGLIMAALLVLYFAVLCGEERSAVGGQDPPLSHYAAIRQDRELAKEFEGILTDGKLQQIVSQYGFPSEVMKNVGGWWDENFLTYFASEYFSDGFMRGWDDGQYQVPENLIPIEETDYYQFVVSGGKPLYFGYYKGWTKFVDFMQAAGHLLIIWLAVALSPLFAQEQDSKMRPLIYTAEYGRSKDIGAKLAAGLTVTFVPFLAVAGVSFLGVWFVYGLGGAKVLWAFKMFHTNNGFCSLTMVQFVLVYLCVCAMALLKTYGCCMLASATAKTNFGGLLMAAGLLAAPFVFRLLSLVRGLAGIFCMVQPLFLVWTMALMETAYVPFWIFIGIDILTAVFCAAKVRSGVRRE